MVIYARNDNYEIWANTADEKFYVQMAGEEISEEGHVTSAGAILNAEELLFLKAEVQTELVGCSNPRADVYVCQTCIRNQPSEQQESFKITKKIGQINHTCDGYINKDNPPCYEN